jgi:hypothetical protein
MANVIVPNKPAKDIIRIDGICYYLKGSTSSPPTHTNDDIQAEYDNCDDCALDDLSSESGSSNSSSSLSIILPPELLSASSSSGLISSSSSVGFSSSSSFEVSIGNACYYMCIESDWSVANISGTYTYDTNTNSWKQDGGNGELIYLGEPGDISGQWAITHPSSTATDNVVYEALTGLGGDPCPPLNGWSFVPAAGGTESTFNIQEGTCEAVQSSSSSSSEGFSSESSLGFSSSSSSEGISSESSSQGISSESSSQGLSSSSSQSGVAEANACEGVTCPTVNGNANPPSMQITVIADDSVLPITWCGKTWVKSIAGGGPADPLPANQFRSGEKACICPENGYLIQSTGTLKYLTWNNNQAGGNLYFFREYQSTIPRRRRYLFVRGQLDSYGCSGVCTVFPPVSTCQASAYCGPQGTNNTNWIPGSGMLNTNYVDGSGRTFQWSEGLNWP